MNMDARHLQDGRDRSDCADHWEGSSGNGGALGIPSSCWQLQDQSQMRRILARSCTSSTVNHKSLIQNTWVEVLWDIGLPSGGTQHWTMTFRRFIKVVGKDPSPGSLKHLEVYKQPLGDSYFKICCCTSISIYPFIKPILVLLRQDLIWPRLASNTVCIQAWLQSSEPSSSGFRSTHYQGPVSCCAVAWTQGFVPAGQVIYWLHYIFSFFFCFTYMGSFCSSGWPHTQDLLASVSPVLGLQIWCTMANYKKLPSALTLITREGWRGHCLSSKN